MVVLHSDSSPRRLPSACLPGLPLAGRLLPFPFERCRRACPVVRPQVRSLPFPACRLFGEQPRFQTCQFFRRTLPDGTVVASDGGFRVVTGEVPIVLAQVVVPPQPGDTGKVLRQPVLLHRLLRYFPLTVPAVAGEPLVAQYEVQPPVQAQQQTQAGQQQQPEGAPQQSAGQTEQNPQYKYRPEDIDWNSLAALGVQREQIEGNGMLDQMLRGFQTDKTVRVHFHFDGISHSNDSQLSLKPGTNGRLTVCSHGILDPEKMQKQFFGYDITDSDKQVLRQTGNMGHPATVTNRAGEQVEALVSRNLKTNELVAFPLSKVNIPAEKNGHTFTPDEIARLKQGEAVVCRFLSRAKEGEQPKIYPAPVQFSAAKMQLEFLFGDRGRLAMDAYKANLKQTANQEVPKTFRKQELTEKSRLELEAGGTVKVSGLVDKKGKAYQGYITWKPGEKPAFMFPKDYNAALEEGRVKPAVENEVQVAVNSEGKTVETTRNLKEALQSAQQRPTGEQKQQQEQKEDRKQAQKQEQPDKPKRSRGVRR